MYKQITKLTLASLIFTSSQHAMEIKPLSLGLGALASLAALAYAYTKKATPTPSVKMFTEHTSGIEAVLNPYVRFTLCTSKDIIIGSICTNYCPADQSAYIETLNVSAEYQKHGYGKQLWDRTIAELKKHDIHTITWKAVPIDLSPSSIGTDEYQQKLDALVAWYQKRGGTIIKKDSTEVYMKMLI